MKIRAMVFDLDRTLLRNDRSISAYTKSVLDRCREKGIYSIIATARPPRAIGVYEEMIRPNASVTMNGASLRMNGREMRSVSMGAQTARELIQKIDRLLPGRPWSLEATSGLYANFDTSTVWDGPPAPMVNIDTVPDEPAYKVLVGLTEAGDADVLRSIVPEDTYLEIAEGALGVDKEEAVSFGDDLADIEMLKALECGVAVGNALDSVKAAADEVTGSNEEDGVAKWLEKYAGI